MAEAKKKLPAFKTPRLVFKFPKLVEADFGSNEYPKPDGEFSTKAIGKASDPAVQKLIAQLQPLHDAAVAKAEEEFKKLKAETRKKLGGVKVNDLYTELLDQETEEPTGEVEFKFAMKHRIEIKKGPKAGTTIIKYPALFDAKGRPMVVRDRKGKVLPNAPQIWGGTVGIIAFEASDYFIPGTGAAGLKLNLTAVQIIDLVSGGQRSASSFGFGEEDGYEGEDYSGGADEDDGDSEASDDEDENDDF
ncbi:hypothetical protein Ga0061061_11723 [Chelatococcus sambhunathii]|uniref:Single-stranded DNA-binding protein BPT7 domain-containing protein n=1 Tax=Chelatococcus sambhunathii TaxID=363953 RepID=A0ABM9UD65_9HYPH|nr:hypothetical protein [Chelatococcus sambhunathii]CUA90968.1 hypothetical protein Ga0061061_11723 [Chelatococcus sambhunathii]